ncbi:MAG TPA: alpha/beta hydrolase [Rhizomicrobium sp.]
MKDRFWRLLCCLALIGIAQASSGPKVDAILPSPAIHDAFFMTDDRIRIHYLVAGRMTAKPPIVFIPGWRLTASLWNRQMQVFSRDRLVIAIDSRSQGDSSIALFGNTPERRAIDLHQLIASRRITKFSIVAWSQGVQDTAAYIERYGTTSLATITLVDSPISAGPEELTVHPGFSKAVLSRIEQYDLDPGTSTERSVRSVFGKSYPDPFIRHVIDKASKTPPSIAIAMLTADIFGIDRRSVVNKIDRPTLVIASSTSPLLDAQKDMAAAIPSARWIVVPEAGHALFIDEPDIFDRELTALLEAARA